MTMIDDEMKEKMNREHSDKTFKKKKKIVPVRCNFPIWKEDMIAYQLSK